jgi:hypothetical protein
MRKENKEIQEKKEKLIHNAFLEAKEQALNQFDFAKVQKVMYTLNWQWVHYDDVPSIYALVQQAEQLIDKAIEVKITQFKNGNNKLYEEIYSCGTGGFEVTITPFDISISFKVEDVNIMCMDDSSYQELNTI